MVLLPGSGKRLKQIRTTMNLTQAEFADKLGIMQQTLSRYEKSKAEIPDKIKIKLHKMDINLTWLLTGEGEMHANDAKVGFSGAQQIFKQLAETDEIDLEILFMLKSTGFKPGEKKKLKQLVEFGIKAIQSEGDIEFD